jgi:elongation factor Tu
MRRPGPQHVATATAFVMAMLAACRGATPAAQAPAPAAPPAPDPTPAPDPAPTPAPTPVTAPGLILPIADAFQIAGKGVVVTGTIVRGTIEAGQTLQLIGLRPTREVTVLAAEGYRTPLEGDGAGQQVGVLLQGVLLSEVARGQVLVTHGVLSPVTTISADLALAPTADGGRKSSLATDYRALVGAWTATVSASVTLPRGLLALHPGSTARVRITFDQPLAVQPGLALRFTEGGRTIGIATVVAVEAP